MRLYDLAKVIRSKNAGPFTLTVDLMFDNDEAFNTLLSSPAFTADAIAGLYGVDAGRIRIIPFPQVKTVKVSMPRVGASSGAPGDRDVYGCQQHFPLADIEL